MVRSNAYVRVATPNSVSPEELPVSEPLRTLYYTRCAVPTPLGIAARLGWFTEEFARDGIDVKVVVESDNVAAREAHYDHSVDNLFRLGGSIPALWANACLPT